MSVSGVPDELEKEIAVSGQNIFETLVRASRKCSGKHIIIEDQDDTQLNYKKLLLASVILGKKLNNLTEHKNPVGVMLPNVAGVAVTFFALSAYGRTPAMLNFTSGVQNILACLQASQCKQVLTSRRFIKLGELEDIEQGLIDAGYELIYLEDVKKSISALDKIRGLLGLKSSCRKLVSKAGQSDDTAVILFTSGSEGLPKGVVLTHANIIANVNQIYLTRAFQQDDIIFNCLPVFHSFGLTAGLLMPVLRGMKSYLYPTPLHYKIIPELIEKHGATILFGTDTFLFGYGRFGEASQLKGLRLVIAGAEKLKERTQKLWNEKIGIQVYEGYGATETSPVLSVNLPNANKNGSVGKPVQGMECRLEPVPGLQTGGALHVRGPNIMAGYLRPENPGVLEKPEGGWHDMGDIVEIDGDGYITIVGRTKRFAKIGGEMISLAAVEDYVASFWPDHMHVAVAIADERKGEQIILVTEKEDAQRDELTRLAKEKGITEIMLPRMLKIVTGIPLLGSGKVDFAATAKLLDEV